MKIRPGITSLTDSELLAIKLAWQEMERDRIIALLNIVREQHEALIRLMTDRNEIDHSRTIARSYENAIQMIRANS